MPGRRGVLPLALLIVAVLGAGIAFAVIRLGEERDQRALPTPSPTEPTPTETVSPTPTETETPSPPPTKPPKNGDGRPDGDRPGDGVPTDGATPLADTGGETAPWLLLGGALIGLSLLLGRLARRPS